MDSEEEEYNSYFQSDNYYLPSDLINEDTSSSGDYEEVNYDQHSFADFDSTFQYSYENSSNSWDPQFNQQQNQPFSTFDQPQNPIPTQRFLTKQKFIQIIIQKF